MKKKKKERQTGSKMAKFQLFKDLRYRRHGGEQFFRHPLQSQVQQRKKKTLLTASELLSSHAAMRTDVLDENRKSGVMCDLNGDVPRRATHILYEYPFFFFAAIVLTIYSLFSLSLSCVVSQCRVLLSFPILPS